MADLAALLAEQHRDLRALLADLARQPAVTETITGPQLRARRRVVRGLERTFVAQTAVRLRHLWPALCAAWPDGRSYSRLAWDRAREIQHRMAKRQWVGERDPVLGDLEAGIVSGIEDYLALEEHQLPRIEELDAAALARRLRSGGPRPTRPHPDLPQSPRLAALMLPPAAAADRVLDLLGRPRE